MKVTAVIFCLVVITALVYGALFIIPAEIIEVDGKKYTLELISSICVEPVRT